MPRTVYVTKAQRAEWIRLVRALKSGKYLHGVGKLCRLFNGEMRYCCLGVQADVWGAEWYRAIGGSFRPLGFSSDLNYLYASVWLEKMGSHPKLLQSTLGQMNDLSTDGFNPVIKHIVKTLRITRRELAA